MSCAAAPTPDRLRSADAAASDGSCCCCGWINSSANWIRDKGFGIGARIPRITSPFTGEEEQAVTFLLIAGVSIVLFMLVIRATVADQTFEEANFDFILAVGEALKANVGGWLGTFYWVAGFIALFSTNIAVLDMVGRIVADILKVGPLSGNETWTENKMYFAVIWAEIAVSAVILFSGLNQPLTLAVIASVLNGMVMFVYSVLLVQLNRFTLPTEIRMENHRFGWMIWAVAFFGFFTVLTRSTSCRRSSAAAERPPGRARGPVWRRAAAGRLRGIWE